MQYFETILRCIANALALICKRLLKSLTIMKFTKEQALEKLRGILTNDGKKTLRMSEKSIERQLETLTPLIADDEMELDTFIEKVKASFEVMNSNVEKDNSDFVNQWKREHPEKNPDNGGTGGAAPQDPSPEMKDLLDRMKALEDKNSAMEREKTLSQKRRDLKKKLKDKGISNDEWCDMVMSEISITDDTDVDAKAESLLKLYNKQKAEVKFNVGPLGTGGGDLNKKSLFSDIKEMKKKDEENK